MVYKIVGDFSGDNLKNMIDKLLISFKFIYIRNVLYVSVQSYKIWKERKGALQWILRNPPFDKCFVMEIDETNIISTKLWLKFDFTAILCYNIYIERKERKCYFMLPME